MKLTEIEQALIDGMEVFKVRRGISAQIFLILDGEKQYLDMIHYMQEHPKATGEELLAQARRIAG